MHLPPPQQARASMPQGPAAGGSPLEAPTRPGTDTAREVCLPPQDAHSGEASRSDMDRMRSNLPPQLRQTYS
jgi:hypothetical protein